MRRTQEIGKWTIFILAFYLLFAGHSVANDSDFKRFEQWVESSKTLEAKFIQTLESGALGTDLEERGLVVLQRPGLMRWDYQDPEIKVALIRKDEVQLFLPEDEQLILSQVPPDGDLLPRLLLGQAPIRELFEVEKVPEGVTASFRLVPKSAERTFESVDVTVDRKGALRSAIVTDSGGNTMSYRFQDWKRNRSIALARFEIEVPPSTEIIRPEAN